MTHDLCVLVLVLSVRLREFEWLTASGEASTMWEFYQRYYVPFGELLTDMEREGIYVDAKGHLKTVEIKVRHGQTDLSFYCYCTSYKPGDTIICRLLSH